MNDTEDLMVVSINEMIVRAARRLVEQRQLDAARGLPEPGDAQRLQREVLERLVKLRHAMLSERPPGSAVQAIVGTPPRGRRRARQAAA